MTKEEKIEMIDKFLKELDKKEIGSLPELLNGFQKYADVNSLEEKKHKILESEVLELGIARIFGKGIRTKDSYGFYTLEILPKGTELVLNGKSVKDIYDREEKKEMMDKELKELQLKNAKLDNDLKQFQSIKDWAWIIAVGIAIVSGVMGYFLRGFQF
jgi:hypothetical protein